MSYSREHALRQIYSLESLVTDCCQVEFLPKPEYKTDNKLYSAYFNRNISSFYKACFKRRTRKRSSFTLNRNEELRTTGMKALENHVHAVFHDIV